MKGTRKVKHPSGSQNCMRIDTVFHPCQKRLDVWYTISGSGGWWERVHTTYFLMFVKAESVNTTMKHTMSASTKDRLQPLSTCYTIFFFFISGCKQNWLIVLTFESPFISSAWPAVGSLASRHACCLAPGKVVATQQGEVVRNCLAQSLLAPVLIIVLMVRGLRT